MKSSLFTTNPTVLFIHRLFMLLSFIQFLFLNFLHHHHFISSGQFVSLPEQEFAMARGFESSADEATAAFSIRMRLSLLPQPQVQAIWGLTSM